MQSNPMVLIIGMAIATYATRAGGVWLMNRVTLTPFIEKWLKHIPGAILIAIVAPIVANSAPKEWGAVAITLVVGMMTRNILLTMIVGIVSISILRNFI